MQGAGLLNGAVDGSAAGDSSALPVNVQTILNLKRDSLSYWQNLTCFFNRWWYPEPDRITLPYCFFHVVKYSERENLDLSEKRMILYEPPETTTGDDATSPVRAGLMQTVADNVVIHPKEYEIEAIVPYMPFGRHVRQGIETAKMFNEVLGFFGGAGGGITPESVAYITGQLSSVIGTNGYANVASSGWNLQEEIITPEASVSINSDNQVNKNSLDTMFAQGNIIEFKTWMGFDYKYVIITEKTSEKRGTEDDVWRVHMTLKEVPVLTLAPIKGSVQSGNRTWLTTAIDRYGLPVGEPKASSRVRYYQLTATAGEGEAE